MRRQLVTALGAIACLAILPAQASAFSSASLFQDPGATTVWDSNNVYDSHDSRFNVNGTASDVTVSMQRTADSAFYASVEFVAPAGQVLQQGKSYPNAQRAPFPKEGRPGLEVTEGTGCNTSHGSFEIIDLATAPDGKVTRLRAVYENHCNEQPPAAYGEIRYGFPEPTAPVASPAGMRWPARDLQRPPTPRPITVRAANSAVRFTGAQITGSGASSFAVTNDGCTKANVPAGGTCTVWAQFAPIQAGQRNATLRLARSDGGTTTTDLSGYAYGGTTEFTGALDRADTTYNHGKDLRYTAADGVFFADSPHPWGDSDVYGVAVNTPGGAVMVARFYPPAGEHLVVGKTYTVGPEHPAYEGGPFMELGAGTDGRCDLQTGSFRIDELRLDTDGQVRATDIAFVDHCQADKPVTVTGHFARRGGDTTPPAAWMQPLGPAEWPPYGTADPPPGPGPSPVAGAAPASSSPATVGPATASPSSATATRRPAPVAAPTLGALRLTPTLFRVATSKTARRGGTTVVYRDSKVATSRFTVERRTVTRRHGRSVIRWTRLPGSLAHHDVAGTNRFAVTGKLGRRALSPGPTG